MSGGVRKLLAVISYRGTAYMGYQVQGGLPTVTRAVQDAIERVFKQRLAVKGCSRTDSGVHAQAFAVTFETSSTIPANRVVYALNVNLPEDIAALYCREVPGDFHPRYDCVGKRYIYKFFNSDVKNPFGADLMLHYPHALDHERLNEAVGAFVGKRDFSAFCSAKSSVEDHVRTVYSAGVRRDGEVVTFEVSGDGFLYNMVRIMAGTVIELARGGIAAKDLPEIIAGRDRKAAGFTAPAHGLYLADVWYKKVSLGMGGEGDVSLVELMESGRLA